MPYFQNLPETSTPLGRLGRMFWRNQLQDMMDLRSGRMTPQEMPQFKQFAQAMQTLGQNQTNQAMQQGMGRGLQGGALGQFLSGADENMKKAILHGINNMYSQTQQQGAQAAGVGMDWQKFREQLKQGYQGMNLNWDMMKEQQDFAARNDQWNQIMQVLQKVGQFGTGIMGMIPGSSSGSAFGSGGASNAFQDPVYQNYVQGKQWY